MKELLKYRELLLEHFARTSEELAEMLAALPGAAKADPPEQVALEPVEAEITAIVCHLCRFEAETVLPQIARLAGAPVDNLDDWKTAGEETPGNCRSGHAGENFLAMRRQALDMLLHMEIEAWSRQERHPAWGMRSLQWWVEASQAHARQHGRDLQRILAPANQVWTDRKA